MDKKEKISLILNWVFVIAIIILLIAYNIETNKINYFYVNTTSYINTTVYINTSIISISYENKTEIVYSECKSTCKSNFTQEYVNTIIFQNERCKSELSFINRTDIVSLNYDLNISLARCNDKFDEVKIILDDIEEILD